MAYLAFSGDSALFIADIQTMRGPDTANLRYEEISEDEKGTHTVIIDGSVNPEKTTTYKIEVTGSIEPVDGNLEGRKVGFNPETDSISGNVATGQVDVGGDGFRVTGEIRSIELDNPEAATVLVDGKEAGSVSSTKTYQNQEESTLTLRHWGGEGSFEEGYDFSEKAIQRYGETGPDKPSLNPDFFYSGSWEGSFPTTVAHDAMGPLERIDYGKVGLSSVNDLPAWNDPRFEEGHLQVGHTYGFYSKEGNFVVLNVLKEEEIPREDWHIGALTFSWKYLGTSENTAGSGCPLNIEGKWVETKGSCQGTIWDISTGGQVPRLSAQVQCENGYRGSWEARNVSWSDQCLLRYQIVHHCTICKRLSENRTEWHTLKFQNSGSAVLTLEDGTEIYLGRPR